MKIKDAINMANLMEQGNVLPKELAILFLSELDGMIQSDIMLHAPEEIVSYDNEEQELLLRPPHDKLYVHYLVMMIRNQQQEYEGYQNTQAAVDEKLKTFRRWYVQHYRPADTDSRSYMGGTSADTFGFAYLTAYGLAVRNGYQGTEEQWLESLHGENGDPGEPARMRYDADREMIQWGVGDTWYDLFGLQALRDPAVEAFLREVGELAEAASGSETAARGHAKTAENAAAGALASAGRANEHAERAGAAELGAAGEAGRAAGSAQKAATAQAAAETAASAALTQAVAAGDHAKAAEEAAARAEAAAENAGGGSTGDINDAIDSHNTNLAAHLNMQDNLNGLRDKAISNAIGSHSTDSATHADIRNALEALRNRVNAALNSDDVSLDQLAEIVAYIKSNKSLIDAITTSKVSVADIVDNIVTNVSNKPLSAAMGVALASDIDSVRSLLGTYQPKGDYALRATIPTKVSQLSNDADYLPRSELEGYATEDFVKNKIAEAELGDGSAVVAEAGIRDAGRKPVKAMISFMDDDCRKEVYHRKAETPNEPSLWELIQELGIPYTLACPPGNIYDPENPVEGNEEYLTVGELQEMHQGGVDISCHHWRQYNMDDTGLLPTEDDYDADLTRCLEQFREWGITDVISVAYPQGVIADNYLHVAKRHFRMGFGVKKAINQRPYASFRMDRCETFPTGSAYVADLTLALAEAKARVDTLAQDGGWLICMTHAWYDTFSPGDLRSLVAYIREQGIEIVGVNEAIRTSGNVVEVGDIVKPLEEQTAPFFVVDADGNTHTNALHNYTPSGETLTEITPAYNLGYLSGGNGVRMTSDDTDRRITDDIPVQAGEVYRLTCSSIWSGAAYAVLTAASGGTVVDIVAGTADTPSTVLTDHEITIPDGGTILRVSCNLSVQPDGFRIRRVDNAGGGLTEEDKAAITAAVVEALPKYAGEVS